MGADRAVAARRAGAWLSAGVFDAMLESRAEMVERAPSADMSDADDRPGAPLRSRHKQGAQQTAALGRSRGGFTSKLPARCDAKGRPLGFVLTGGEAHDIKDVAPLQRMITARREALLADKGYAADAIGEELATAGTEAVIIAKRNREKPAPHDAEKYKWRNLIERLFNRLKNWRRVATRYDKSKASYLGFVAIAAVRLWLPVVDDAKWWPRLVHDEGVVGNPRQKALVTPLRLKSVPLKAKPRDSVGLLRAGLRRSRDFSR